MVPVVAAVSVYGSASSSPFALTSVSVKLKASALSAPATSLVTCGVKVAALPAIVLVTVKPVAAVPA